MSRNPQSVTPFAQLAANNIRSQISGHLTLVHSVEQDRLVAAQQEAENALSMALHYLRKGSGNVPGAMRKAVQALGAMDTLQAAGRKGGAA